MSNRLSSEKQANILHHLVEGLSIRSTVRITGVSKNTITKLLVDTGAVCLAFQDETLKNLPCKYLECDEIWSFCYAKQKNIPEQKIGEYGIDDIWTWTAICADTHLVPCWFVGGQSSYDAQIFINDLASRLVDKVQLTTDGHKAYLTAIENTFGSNIDYAVLHKISGKNERNSSSRSIDEQITERKYSSPACSGIDIKVITGNPQPERISTLYVERQNLTMRMNTRRFTRLTNGFSKKIENHMHAISLHYMYYNFARAHKTLTKNNNGYPTTPAMAVGKANRVWTIKEIAELTR